jgi:molybdate/tungstate transport system permease protein
LFENYIIAGVILITSAALCLIIKKLRYHILTPLLVLLFYYIIVNLFVPGTINFYDSLISVLNVYIVVGIIIVILILGLFLIIKLPDLKISKIMVISPVSILGYGLAAILIILVLLPIVNLLTSEDWGTLADTFQNQNVSSAIGLSVLMALFATLASLIFGLPLGYVLARKEFAGRSIIQGVVDVPIVIPHTVAGIALLTVFGAQGIIGAPLDEMGVKFIDAWPGIVVAMMFVSFPFVVNSARDGFQAIDPRMENVARSLGATRVNTFTKVLLPLSYKNIVTGSIMCWARAISEFGAVIILVYFPMIAPTLIYDRFTSFGLDASSPIAVLLVMICLVVFIILRFLTGLKPRALRSSNKRFV